MLLKNKKYLKKSKTRSILGADFPEVKKHIEGRFTKGMSWKNYGEWHIDHIYPLSWCDTEEEVFIYSHYSNLQPLWAEDNLNKSDKWIGGAEPPF